MLLHRYSNVFGSPAVVNVEKESRELADFEKCLYCAVVVGVAERSMTGHSTQRNWRRVDGRTGAFEVFQLCGENSIAGKRSRAGHF